jgi:phosphoglycolate phosphatase-like HAD superfamily hydrolase
MPYKVVIFDFDGVLADTLDDILHFGKIVSKKLGFLVTPTMDDLNALDQMSFADFGRQLGLPEEQIEPFVQGNFELFNEREAPPRLFPGMDDVIKGLSISCKMGIVTGNSSDTVWRFLSHYGIEKYIAIVLGADIPGLRLEKVRRVMKELNAKIGNTFIVGDAVSDIRTAREAGIFSIGVAWGHQRPEKLLAEKPDYFAKSPPDFIAILTRSGNQGDIQN